MFKPRKTKNLVRVKQKMKIIKKEILQHKIKF